MSFVLSPKIFLIGDPKINQELTSFLSPHAEITPELSNDIDLIIDSTNYPRSAKLENLKFIDQNCSSLIPVLTSSLCTPVSELTPESRYPERLIGIGLYPTFSNAKLIEIAPTKITDNRILENAEKILTSLKIQSTRVPDLPGLVFPRILTMIINEAAQLYYEKIASREDIGTAMKLGTNYPFGPLEWADRTGIDLVYNILTSLKNHTGDDRYIPHPILKEMIDKKIGFYPL